MKQKFPLRLILVFMLVLILSLTLFACDNGNPDPGPGTDPPTPPPAPTKVDVDAVAAFDMIINGAYPGAAYFFSIDTAAEVAFNTVTTNGNPSKLNGKKYAIEAKINLDTDPAKNFLEEGSESEIFFQITEVGAEAPLFGVYYDDRVEVDNRPGIGLIVGEGKYYIPASSLGLFIQKQNANSAAEGGMDIMDIVKTVLLPMLFGNGVMDTEANTITLTLDFSKLFAKFGQLFEMVPTVLGGKTVDQLLADFGIALTQAQILALKPQIRLVLSAAFDDVDADKPALKNASLSIVSDRDENVHIERTDGSTIVDFTIPTMNIVATVSKLAIVNGAKAEITMPDMSAWTKTNALNLNINGEFNLLGPNKEIVHQLNWKLVSNLDPFLMLEKNFLLDDPAFKEDGQYFHFQVSHICTDEEKNDPDSWCSRHLSYSEGSIIDIFYDPANLDPNIFLSLDNLGNLLPTDFLNGLLEGILGEGSSTIVGMIPMVLNMLNIFVPIDVQAFNNDLPAVETPVDPEVPAAAAALDVNKILDIVKKVIGALGYIDFSDGLTIGKGIIAELGGTTVTDPISLIGMSIVDIVDGILEAPTRKVDEQGNPVLDTEGNPVLDTEGNPVIVTSDVQSLQFKVTQFKFAQATDYDVIENAIAKQPDGSYRSKYTTLTNDPIVPFDKLQVSGNAIPVLKDLKVADSIVNDGYIMITGKPAYISGKIDTGDDVALIQMLPSEVEALAGSGAGIGEFTFVSLDGETYTLSMNSGTLAAPIAIAKVIGFKPDVIGEQTIKLVMSPIGGTQDLNVIYSLLDLLSSQGLNISLPYIPAGQTFITKINVIAQPADDKVTLAESAIKDMVDNGIGFAVDQILTNEQMSAKLNFELGEDANLYTKMFKSSVAATLSVDPEFIQFDMNEGAYKLIKPGTTTITYTALGVSKSIDITIGQKVATVRFVDSIIDPTAGGNQTVYLGQTLSVLGSGIEYTVEGDDTVYTASIQPFVDYITSSLASQYTQDYAGARRFVEKTTRNNLKYSFMGREFTFNFKVEAPSTVVPTVDAAGINLMENWKEGISGVTLNYPEGKGDPVFISSEYLDVNMYGNAEGLMETMPMSGQINLNSGQIKAFTLSRPSRPGQRQTYLTVTSGTLKINAPVSFAANDSVLLLRLGQKSNTVKSPGGYTLTFADGSKYTEYNVGEYINFGNAAYIESNVVSKPGTFLLAPQIRFGSATLKSTSTILVFVAAPETVTASATGDQTCKVGQMFMEGIPNYQLTLTYGDGNSENISMYAWDNFEITNADGTAVNKEEVFYVSYIIKGGTYKLRPIVSGITIPDELVITLTVQAPTAITSPKGTLVSVNMGDAFSEGINLLEITFADGTKKNISTYSFNDKFTITDAEGNTVDPATIMEGSNFAKAGVYKVTPKYYSYTGTPITLTVTAPTGVTSSKGTTMEAAVGSPADFGTLTVTFADGTQKTVTSYKPFDKLYFSVTDAEGNTVDPATLVSGINFAKAGTYTVTLKYYSFSGSTMTLTVTAPPAA